MEDGANSLEGNPHTRALALSYLAAAGGEQGFNVAPVDLGPDWLREDREGCGQASSIVARQCLEYAGFSRKSQGQANSNLCKRPRRPLLAFRLPAQTN
jgi:hypothetical protein